MFTPGNLLRGLVPMSGSRRGELVFLLRARGIFMFPPGRYLVREVPSIGATMVGARAVAVPTPAAAAVMVTIGHVQMIPLHFFIFM